MKTSGISVVCILLVLGFILVPVVAQQAPQPTAAQPSAPQPSVQPATDQNAPVQVPESYIARTKKQGAFLDMNLNDAIRLALTNNLEIAIEDFNEDLNKQRIIGTRGFYDPRFTFSVGWRETKRPATNVLDAGAGVPVSTGNGFSFNTQLLQQVPGGGAFTLNFDNSRNSSNSTFQTLDPGVSTTLDFQFSQPILKGFRQTQTERQLKVLNLDQKIADSVFEERVSTIVQQVENQYWELVYAIENHETRRQAMELAIVQHRNNQKRVEIGVMAPIEITKSRAAVANSEQDMITSEVGIIEAQNNLKRLLAPDPKASIWNISVIPTDLPEMKDLTLSLDEAIEKALQQRPELAQARYRLEQNEIDRAYYKNQGKPAVNLVARAWNVGSAGDVYTAERIDTDGDGVPDAKGPSVLDPTHQLYGRFGNAWGQAFGFDYFNYQLGVSIEMPFRNRAAEAERAQVVINERQLTSRMKNTQQTVMVDVRNAYESIYTRRKGWETSKVARQLSEEQLAGENKRFEAGLSTNFEVLEYQRQLADAKVRELRALIDYQRALTSLQKAMYTIIDQNDIVVARGQNGAAK